METVPFRKVPTSDLIVDRIFEGGTAGNRGDDPISKILPVGNAGGFRFMGSPTRGSVRALVLYTSMLDAEWPDRIDLTTGIFTYYGDNKSPGRELHDTPRKGNLALRDMFRNAQTRNGRERVPPIFLFAKGGSGSDAVFRGLLVPGAATVQTDEQLVAIWRSSGDERFQNYRATFTVLNVPRISREWLEDIAAGVGLSVHRPQELARWQATGVPVPLAAPRPIEHRTREQQLPSSDADLRILHSIYDHFSGRPHDFEHCAASLWWMLAPATEEIEVTRPSRDGGRDAVGTYRIGPPSDQIKIDFALEAKCYSLSHGAGVRDVSRLISRLRHRNFGVFVTTSYVNPQAYREVRDDRHPVAIVAGRDIVEALKRNGLSTVASVKAWLTERFPVGASAPRLEPDFRADRIVLHDANDAGVAG